jgi:hypothetical protein
VRGLPEVAELVMGEAQIGILGSEKSGSSRPLAAAAFLWHSEGVFSRCNIVI